jgi:hypothetical protein
MWSAGLILAVACGLSVAVASRLERTLPPAPAVYDGVAGPAASPPRPTPKASPAIEAAAAKHPAEAPAPIVRHPRALLASAAVRPTRPAEKAPDPWATYLAARQAYDQRERAEGFRWAMQYRVSASTSCQAAQGRDAAFMQGCLDYLNS